MRIISLGIVRLYKMPFFRCFIFLLFTYFNNAYSTVLNIEELNSIHYNIDIVNNPVLKNKEWTTDIVTITNKHGQEYICTLPEVQIPENENKKEEDLLDHLVDISELLKPMEAAPCLIKKKDWWSYEFCYGSVIKQYHLEDNKVVGTILILGKYESEYNWRNNTKSKNKLQKFHTQHYVNGTRCDITGEARRAEVRFHCEEGVGDYIQQVDEPESCRYVIIIATTRVCHHPYLKPNPNRTPHNINCAPALSQDEFDHYQKIQEMKKNKQERERLLRLTEKSISDQSFTGEDSASGSGDFLGGSDNVSKDPSIDDDDDEARFSIRLVTIPIPKNRGTRNVLKSEINGLLSEQPDEQNGPLTPDGDGLDSLSSGADSPYEDLVENDNDFQAEDEQGFGSAKPYLNVNEMMDKEFLDIFKDRVSKRSEDGEDDEEEEEEEDEENEREEVKKKEGKGKSVKQQFEAFRSQVNKLARDWMENQNGNRIQELLEKIKQSLDENIQQLQETVNEYSESSVFNYVEDLIEMTEKYKKLPKAEDFDLADEETVTEALQSMAALLSEAELEVLRAIRKMKFDRMEKYLEAHLKRSGGKAEQPSLENAEEGDVAADDESLSPSDSSTSLPPFSAHPQQPAPTPSNHRVEDQTEAEGEDGNRISENENNAETEEERSDPRHVKILNEKSMDGTRKTRLEQSIKERLEKSGLDNIGRKIEVKILTPNYLDDDEKDTLSSLSQEETEAFHNMIVNILSASAEELKERERHKNLESSYNFHLEEAEPEETSRPPADLPQEQDTTDSLPLETPSEDSDINNNNNDLINDDVN